MRAYPHFNKRKTHDLNGIWDFTFMDNGGLDDVIPKAIHYNDRLPVPSAFDALPAYAGKRGLGIYRCFVEVTPHVETVLKIGGAGMTGRVYVDGVLLAEHSGTYTPFEVRIPAAVNVRREIVVATDNRYDFVRCPLHENYHDFYNYGGLIRQVWLEELPVNAIRRVQVVTEDLTTGQIRVKVEFYGAPAPVTASIDGGAVKAASGEEFTVLVPEPTLWSVEAPTLHRLTVDSGSDSITVRFGLRQVTAAKGQVLLNGKPVKLLGYCRHEAHPQFGPATPETLMAADLQLLREMGCNFVRGSHYQQDPRFLDLCDELGFLVFSESTGWGADHKQLTDPTFIRHQLEQTRVMVETDFNHPSVILWGFLNEGASDAEFARECYTRLIALIRALDPSRLVTYASNRYLKDIFLDQVDVVSFNFYPGWYSPDRETDRPLGEVLPRIRGDIEGLAKLGLSGKPFIISEIGAAALYGCRDPHQGFWTEDFIMQAGDFGLIILRKDVQEFEQQLKLLDVKITAYRNAVQDLIKQRTETIVAELLAALRKTLKANPPDHWKSRFATKTPTNADIDRLFIQEVRAEVDRVNTDFNPSVFHAFKDVTYETFMDAKFRRLLDERFGKTAIDTIFNEHDAAPEIRK